jgi:hypothetical protein
LHSNAGGGHRAEVKVTVPGIPATEPSRAAGGDSASPRSTTIEQGEGVRISEGSGRSEFGQGRMLRLLWGLVIIAGAGLTAWILLRWKNTSRRRSSPGLAGASRPELDSGQDRTVTFLPMIHLRKGATHVLRNDRAGGAGSLSV